MNRPLPCLWSPGRIREKGCSRLFWLMKNQSYAREISQKPCNFAPGFMRSLHLPGPGTKSQREPRGGSHTNLFLPVNDRFLTGIQFKG